MITIIKTHTGVTVEGHACFDAHGRDIVCAGVSTLIQNLIFSFEDLTTDAIEYKTESGRAVLKYRNLSERGQLLVDSFFVGIKTMSESYPDYIRLIGGDTA